MSESCGSCRFWKLTDRFVGDCRRYPPNLVTDAPVTITIADGSVHRSSTQVASPWTTRTDWCGEYVQAIPPEPEGRKLRRMEPPWADMRRFGL